MIIIYFEYAIFNNAKESVGLIGFIFADFSHKYFGFISYVYLILVLYPLFLLNFEVNINKKDLFTKTLAFILFVLSSLILQSLFVKSGINSGEIGNFIVSSMNMFIGFIGLCIFILIGFIISILILFEDINIQISLPSFIKNFKKNKTKMFKTQLPINKVRKEKKHIKKNDIIIEEQGDTASIIIQATTDEVEQNINKIKDNNEKETSTNDAKEVITDITNKEDTHFHGIIVEELEENKKLLEEIELGQSEKPKDFKLPSSSFFQMPITNKKSRMSESVIDKKIQDLLEKLSMFKIDGDVVRTYTGPVVTTFEFKPAPNVKVSKILNLQDDLAMALKAQTIRIQAPIPGKDVIGIEVPNDDTQTIYIRELLESEIFKNSKSPLTIILGKDIVGQAFVTDLKKLPHLLIAGTTGSGKSVGINAMILSLLYKNSPDDLKLIMIDPKMLEFSMYNDIPHLLTPVITKASEAINALANMVIEMERRYSLMSKTKTKNIDNYNEKAKRENMTTFPFIVIIIDELADLMMTSGKEVEYSIARLAQMARASGIHLIVATQRPSVDVVTGLIKANLPSRLSYKVGQKIDSKIILDSMGAESLLGQGDMLFTPPGMSGLVRIHAPWSSETEIEKVTDFLKEQREVSYDMSFIKEKTLSLGSSVNKENLGEVDELFEDAKEIIYKDNKTSISYIQRKLKIGYNRAASIIEQLENEGVLSKANHKGNREILTLDM